MARDFDGVDDVINCGSGSQLDDLAAWTHCAWFYADTVGEAGFGTMCRKNANDAGLGKVMHIQATAAVRAACRRATTNQQLVSANNTYPLNQWNFVAYTYDGTTGRLYVATPGGVVSEVTYATNTQGVGAITADGNTNLTIGNDSTGATTFDGRIAYVRWFNAALSLDELTAVMYNRPARPSALVGFWPLIGASPEPDWSGYVSNGTVTGSVVADGPPVPPPYIGDEDFLAWVVAASGNAASADGVGTAVAVGASVAAASASSDGIAIASAIGASDAASNYSADGTVPVADFVGISVVLGSGLSDGVGDAQATGASTGASAYSADGSATAVADGASTATASYSSDGIGDATAVGASTAAANYLADGDVPTAVFVGDSVAAGAAAASSDGVSTAEAEGASVAATNLSADGESSAVADGTGGSTPAPEVEEEAGTGPQQGGGYYAHNPWREYKKKREKRLELDEQEVVEIAMLAAKLITADYMRHHGVS